MGERTGIGLLALAFCLAAAPAGAGDPAKRECRQGCQEALRSCKADCRPERDSGDLQASQLYVDCDAECHAAYTDCVDPCTEE